MLGKKNDVFEDTGTTAIKVKNVAEEMLKSKSNN